MILIALVGLASCSEVPNSPYAGPNQPRVVPAGASVTIENVRSQEEATPWAEDYCTKQGRKARFLQMEAYRLHHKPTDSAVFECVQS
jgi:hypothetical protein